MSSVMQCDRGKLRMERLQQIEQEQLQWEQEALVMPEDLNRALFLSFESVKTEFSDLDGLSWSRYPVPLVTNPWAVEEPTPKLTCAEMGASPDRTPAHSPHQSPRRPLPYMSPRADKASQDTIRVSRRTQSSRSPLQPANQFFSNQYSTPQKDPPTHPTTNLAMAYHGLRQPTY